MTGIMMAVMSSVPQTVAIPSPSLYLDAYDYSGSGTTWTAETGSDATLVNTPTYVAPSPTYFSFAPASGEKATVPDLGNLNRWTIESWFRLTSSLSGQVTAVVCNQFDLSSKLNFSMGTNRSPTSYNICIGFYDGAWRTTTGFAPTLNTWYHCVGTYDGTTIRQYVNAVQDSTLSYSGTPQSGGEVRIASRWDSQITPTDFFPGDVGLVRIWDSALTDTQVSTLYDQNLARFSLTPTTTSFTTVETTSWTAPTGVSRVQYLVVGGGGGGGQAADNAGAGGGGAGMVLADYLDVSPGTTYTVTVGDGGIGGNSGSNIGALGGSVGSSSVFSTITALGGGGGYASRANQGVVGTAQIGNTTAATGGGGGPGGGGGLGGGGSTGAGSPRSGTTGGAGGAGTSSTITGSSVTYGAGASGGNSGSQNGGTAGTSNTGNGGGGGGATSANYRAGGKGGSGIVVVRYGS